MSTSEEPEITVDQAVTELFSQEAQDRNVEFSSTSLIEQLILSMPDVFYVHGFIGGPGEFATVGGGPGPRVQFKNQESAQFWLDATAAAQDVALDEYPVFHNEYMSGTYSPELGGPGLHTDEAVDASLWDDYVSALDSLGTRTAHNARSTLGGVYEEIRLDDGFAIGERVGIAHGWTPEKNFYRLHTGNSAPDGHLDDATSKLQTFLEDALATLQADHPDNFDEYFGYTDVPIVDTRGVN